MKNFILLLIATFISVSTFAQHNDKEDKVHFIVDIMPSFAGGDKAFSKYIGENLVYPELAKKSGISGKVYVRFIISATGQVSKVTVARGVDPLLDKEAVRVVKTSPKWNPGKQNGKAVSVSFLFPVLFNL